MWKEQLFSWRGKGGAQSVPRTTRVGESSPHSFRGRESSHQRLPPGKPTVRCHMVGSQGSGRAVNASRTGIAPACDLGGERGACTRVPSSCYSWACPGAVGRAWLCWSCTRLRGGLPNCTEMHCWASSLPPHGEKR